jgi:hypothetical protein
MCVCNTENENCMYGACTSCPGEETLQVLLQNELVHMRMEYKQWVMTTLLTIRQQSDKLNEKPCI